MSQIIKALKNDGELKKLKERWQQQMEEPFPGYNYDEYAGIDEYKRKIREELERTG